MEDGDVEGGSCRVMADDSKDEKLGTEVGN